MSVQFLPGSLTFAMMRYPDRAPSRPVLPRTDNVAEQLGRDDVDQVCMRLFFRIARAKRGGDVIAIDQDRRYGLWPGTGPEKKNVMAEKRSQQGMPQGSSGMGRKFGGWGRSFGGRIGGRIFGEDSSSFARSAVFAQDAARKVERAADQDAGVWGGGADAAKGFGDGSWRCWPAMPAERAASRVASAGRVFFSPGIETACSAVTCGARGRM